MLWGEKIPPIFGGNIHIYSLAENPVKTNKFGGSKEFVGKICRVEAPTDASTKGPPREAPEEGWVFDEGLRDIFGGRIFVYNSNVKIYC